MSDNRAKPPHPGSTTDDTAPQRPRGDFGDAELRELLSLGTDWLWETDAQGRYSWLSEEFEPITGVRTGDMLGKTIEESLLGAPSGSKSAAGPLARLEAREPFRNFVYRMKGDRKECRWVSVSGTPRFAEDGSFLGYRGIGRNVTGLAASFEDLQKLHGQLAPATGRDRALSDERAGEEAGRLLSGLERTLDSMTMGVVLLDPALNTLVINRAFFDIWHLPPGAVAVGSPFRALMDINRSTGVYGIAPDRWEDYVASRLDEIRAGDLPPREFRRADDSTLVYSVTSLAGGRRLICYYDVTVMKNREAELAAALERSQLAESVINSVKDPIFVKDENLRFVLVNDAFASLFDLRPADMLGRPGSDFLPAGEMVRFERDERHVLATGQHLEAEETFEVDESLRSRVVQRNRVNMKSGRRFVAGMVFDVTELKRREIEAEQARQRLADVLDSIPTGVIIYDSDDRFVLANRAIVETMPHLEAAFVPGSSLREQLLLAHANGYGTESDDPNIDRLHGTDPGAWVDAYLAKYRDRHSVHEWTNSDGRWFQAINTRMADGTLIGVQMDINDLKERERALRSSMRKIELYGHVLDDLPVAVYVKSDNLAFEFVNKAWTDMTGVTKDQATGKTDLDFFGSEGEGFTERDLDVIRTGATNENEEVITHRDGLQRQLIARKSRLVASDGTVHLIGSSVDISELKSHQRSLQEARSRAELADRAKSEFLANMSHEIRTPMNGVLGMAELLAKSDLDPKQKTFTEIIVKSGNALLTIINDILDFSKIDAGQLELDPGPFNLAEAIEDVATLLSTRAKEKDLELIVRLDPDLGETHVGDVGRIRQIITNLLGNAVKFTDAGHVLVSASAQQIGTSSRIRISVSDTGIGIPAAKLDSVFEKFNQVDASSTRRHEGTGLGLAITSRLVSLMGGQVGVESVEGQGSTFWFEIELPNAGDAGRNRIVPSDVTGARILVVDDNEVNRAILSEQMASWSFDSCAARSGREGLGVLKAAQDRGVAVDCIVLDYQMPGMNGAEMARIVRQTASVADTPIVLLTSVDQSLAGANYKDLAINAHLTKPARSSALLETLVTTIQRHRSTYRSADPVDMALPSSAATLETPMEQPRDQVPADAGHHRIDILVAEDNEVNQLVFSQILGETGYSFHIVGNGKLALEAFVEMNPRMILMDISMPEMNGLEATRAIRDLESADSRRMPIIGVTAHALKGDRERCLEAGMDDYLPKPISPRALVDKIERWGWNTPRASLSAG